MNDIFHRLAQKTSNMMGSSWAFLVAFAIIFAWIITGPMFHFSDTWQLIINTGTTIITFLMVFLIQNTQNRDTKATQLKLDELIRSTKARNVLIDAEDQPDKVLEKQKERLRNTRERKSNYKAKLKHSYKKNKK